jgi:hypothetical protein
VVLRRTLGGQSKKDNLISKPLHVAPVVKKARKEKEGFTYIRNTLPTSNIGYGTDIIFEPGETKCLETEVAERIIKNAKGFECE